MSGPELAKRATRSPSVARSIPPPRAGGLEVEGLTVAFGPTVAVRDVALRVAPGEVVALLGPSGCGKSTLLRAIAGLEHPVAGALTWDGEDLVRRAPDQRGFGLMFQDHALFPHRTVGQNVAFGLRMAGRGRDDQRAGAAEALARVGLAGFEDRTVDTLSGGEAQRVALARALAPEPRLLMLDEPLGSLDRVLREQLAGELRRVLGELGLAAVHVTHDQEEAYAVADRIVVMRAGEIVRDGAAAEVWSDPGEEFVARFLGHANVLTAADAAALGLAPVPCVVQEAALALGAGPLAAEVDEVRFRGATSRVTLRLAVGVTLALHTSAPPAAGTAVRLTLDPTHVRPLAEP